MVGGRGQKTPKVPHLAHDSQKCYFLSGDVEKATGISVCCWVVDVELLVKNFGKR
ncbi:hypothetical protein SCLCIDRAFT_1224554 [Scleroderma citrinum Foug A]|uniref:Uncharacterized protein n=1 Tax=Scleroderma citrinum Foug A TaxID=1036808 RepID=A0A0C3D5P1_9AGAM|nr:hypothetical protein SCLCIDRAFT_1224554 [Scleroderma citrinum Foug A]